MTDLLEAVMIICFGISWPLNIVKAWKARTAKGTSVLFYVCIFVGYIIKPQTIIDEVEQPGVTFKSKKLFTVMIKYIAPVFVVAILIGYIMMTTGAISL